MRKNFPLLALVLAASLAVGGCAIVVTSDDAHVSSVFDSGVSGNGQVVTENRAIAAFDALDTNGSVQVQVQVGAAPHLEVEGDSNLLPLLRTEVRGGTLKVWLDGSIRNARTLRVVVSTPALSRIARAGSGHLQVDGLNASALDVSSRGSGSMRLQGAVAMLDARADGSGKIDATAVALGSANTQLRGSGMILLGRLNGSELSAELHGSGSITASGTVRQLRAKVFSSGSMYLGGLSAETADLASYGSGSIDAVVTGSVDALTTASGSVNVRGNPADRRQSGKHVRIGA